MLIVTTNDVPGYKITTPIGAVYGVSVRSRSEVGNFLGKVRAIAGGKMAGFEKLVLGARQDSIESMVAQAEKAGANAIVAFRYSSTGMGAGEDEEFIEVTAYGTAVRIDKV